MDCRGALVVVVVVKREMYGGIGIGIGIGTAW